MYDTIELQAKNFEYLHANAEKKFRPTGDTFGPHDEKWTLRYVIY
jgi:hypothetical protein